MPSLKIRDRIVEMRRVPACDLVPHPSNFRRHPEAQMKALKGVLGEIGFAGAILCRKLEDGRLQTIAYGKDPYLRDGLGRRPDSIVAASDREGVDGHPTPKPLKVWSWLLERGSTKKGDVIFDPFCGSGTTLVAAHQLGRKAYGIELSPGYCAVILERLASLGLKPELQK